MASESGRAARFSAGFLFAFLIVGVLMTGGVARGAVVTVLEDEFDQILSPPGTTVPSNETRTLAHSDAPAAGIARTITVSTSVGTDSIADVFLNSSLGRLETRLLFEPESGDMMTVNIRYDFSTPVDVSATPFLKVEATVEEGAAVLMRVVLEGEGGIDEVIGVGQSFNLTPFVEDLRGHVSEGVFSSFVEIEYAGFAESPVTIFVHSISLSSVPAPGSGLALIIGTWFLGSHRRRRVMGR